MTMTARFSGYMKFVGCACAAAGWRLGTFDSSYQILLNVVLFCACIPFTCDAPSNLPWPEQSVSAAAPDSHAIFGLADTIAASIGEPAEKAGLGETLTAPVGAGSPAVQNYVPPVMEAPVLDAFSGGEL